MPNSVGRRQYQPINVHTPWSIRAGLGICCFIVCQSHLPDAHMPYPYLKDLDDSAFHWPTLIGRYTYSKVVLA